MRRILSVTKVNGRLLVAADIGAHAGPVVMKYDVIINKDAITPFIGTLVPSITTTFEILA